MDNGNYIKINRKILEWEWYSDINTCRLFLHMLLKANWKDGKFKGTTVPRGSFISSIGVLSEETGLTIREVRTAITHLKMTGEVTSKSTNKFTVITVKNYDLYQTSDKQIGIQETNERQANDKLTTTIEELEEGKESEESNNTLTVSNDTVCWTDAQQVVDAWNSLDGINHVSRLTESSQRCKMLKCRIKEYGMDAVLMAIENIRDSKFLHGENKRGWMIDFDWFVRPNNFHKVLEGKYNTGGRDGLEGKYSAIDDFLRGD